MIKSITLVVVLLLIILLILLLANLACIRAQTDKEATTQGEEEDLYAQKRAKMVKNQLEFRGLSDPAVLEAMGKVPREEFVLPAYKTQAYNDGPLPIGEGQTISQPYIVALMTELLEPQAEDKILEIGTGSGYQAAILAEIVAEVYTIEIVESLSLTAQETCKKLGYENITFKIGDGFIGWEENAPFDGIIVTCAPDEVPQPLIDQLADGAHLVIPVGGAYPQMLQVLTRKGEEITTESITAVSFVPMTGISEEK